MKYFLDTEFHEYKKKPLFGKAIDTIELISIGIVSEDVYVGGCDPISKDTEVNITTKHGREYYAICKDFNIKAAWNSHQLKDTGLNMPKVKEYWLRENVLRPIFDEFYEDLRLFSNTPTFNLKSFTYLINKIGQSREQIAKDIKEFAYGANDDIHPGTVSNFDEIIKIKPIEFYAYYADYDWVVFCWLFGRMIDLPKGFPMYCRDLKQMLDSKATMHGLIPYKNGRFTWTLSNIENFSGYPKQDDEHNALSDAKWNKEFYEFLINLK